MLGRAISRRNAVFVCVFAAVWAAAGAGTGKVHQLGRLLLAYVAASVAARLLSPLLPRPMLPDLQQRAVLVTGCSSGFGLKIAVVLDKIGVPVLATCRNPSAPAVLDLQKTSSSRLRVIKMDVISDESVAAAAKEVRVILEENQLCLWAVVNNAGVLQVAEAPWTNIEELRDSFDVNTFGHIRVLREFLPMLCASRGRIVNILSLSCRATVGLLAPYTITKRASLALADCAREGLRRFGISVHNIEPSIYKTRMAGVDVIENSMKKEWERCPDSIKNLYGRNYIQRLDRSLAIAKLFFLPEEKIILVADAVVDACLAQDPQDRYVPSFLGTSLEAFARFCPGATQLATWILTSRIKKLSN